MAPTNKPTEGWVYGADVQRVLQQLLVLPHGDHRDAVAAILSNGGLSMAQLVSLARFADSKKLALGKGKWAGGTKHRGAAYHTWLFHLLGGRGAKLLVPPLATASAEEKLPSHALLQAGQRAVAEFESERESLRAERNRRIDFLVDA